METSASWEVLGSERQMAVEMLKPTLPVWMAERGVMHTMVGARLGATSPVWQNLGSPDGVMGALGRH